MIPVRGVAAVLCACVGCGRFGFNDVASTPDAPGDTSISPDGPLASDIAGALACETDVSLIAMPQADELHYLDNGPTQGIIVLQHLDASHHELRFVPLAVTAGAVTTPGFTTFHASADMSGLVVVPIGSGYVAAVTDIPSSSEHVITVDATFHETADVPVSSLVYASVPLAHQPAAGLLVGTNTSTGTLDAAVLTAALQPSGATVTIDGASDSNPAIAEYPSGYVVAWDHPNGAGCQVALISGDGVVTAGPLSLNPPGAVACVRPRVLALADGTIIMTMIDATVTMSPVVYVAVIGASLASVTPIQIGNPDSIATDIISSPTGAYVAVRTTGDSRVVSIVETSAPVPLGTDFGLSGNDLDTETLATIAGSLVHIRTEGGNLIIRKLCR